MNIFSLFCLLVATYIVASKCPESRKPHSTNCSLFYKCVDLPNGEFAWIPTKCNDGLVFQPYLKICVLSENPKDCSTNSHKLDSSSSLNNDHEFNENLDYLSILNENEGSMETSLYNNSETSVTPQTTENVIYQLVSNYKIDIPPKNISEGDIYLSLLNTLITKILIRDNNLKNQFSIYNHNMSKFSNQELNSDKNEENCQGLILQCLYKKQHLQEIDYNQNYEDESVKKIVSVTDNLGNRQYITFDKYNSLKDKLLLESLNVIDCTQNVRLPNETDCRKYYTCTYGVNPIIRDYICPKYTAFNQLSRQCDVKSHSICEKKMFRTSSRSSDLNLYLNLENPCKIKGKVGDSKSQRHFYLCYEDTSTSEMKAVRLECPKYLIFCEMKKVCTTEQLCYN